MKTLSWPLLRKGETVLVHSSLRRLLRSKKGITAPDVLESLLEAVGPRGTLLFPLFNFDFCHGTPFDIRTTRSQMGILTETARSYPGMVRTYNPIYGFAVIGMYQSLFIEYDNHDCLGKDSPFGMLRELDAKIAVIDLPDSQSMTYYHHVEQMQPAPNRFLKNFPGKCTDWYGDTFVRFYTCYVRYEENETYVDPMQEILTQAGVYRSDEFMRVGRARDIYRHTADVIAKGSEGILWRTKPTSSETARLSVEQIST